MENREKQEKLLLESILGKSLKKYDLRLLEGLNRYSHASAYEYGNVTYDSQGIRQVKTSEKNLYLKMHPYATSNVSYELIRIDNEKNKKQGYIPHDYFFSGKKIEVARFRAGGMTSGEGWARLKVWHINGKPSNLVDLTAAFNFKDYLIGRLKKAGINYKEKDRISVFGDDFAIKPEDLGFVVRSCVKFLTKKYKSYLNYARRWINAPSPR